MMYLVETTNKEGCNVAPTLFDTLDEAVTYFKQCEGVGLIPRLSKI